MTQGAGQGPVIRTSVSWRPGAAAPAAGSASGPPLHAGHPDRAEHPDHARHPDHPGCPDPTRHPEHPGRQGHPEHTRHPDASGPPGPCAPPAPRAPAPPTAAGGGTGEPAVRNVPHPPSPSVPEPGHGRPRPQPPGHGRAPAPVRNQDTVHGLGHGYVPPTADHGGYPGPGRSPRPDHASDNSHDPGYDQTQGQAQARGQGRAIDHGRAAPGTVTPPPLPPVPAARQVPPGPAPRHVPHHPHVPPGPARDAPPAQYTPTQPNLPISPELLARADPPTLPLGRVVEGAAPRGARPGPLYVVGDVHGYLNELLAELHANGLVDEDGHWSGGNTRLWFLGDFTDRGPDGIGVLDLVMQLSAEAASVGGYAKALMGNHELLLIGAKRFGDQPVNSTAGTASFLAAWRLNGGQPSDMERLEDHHTAWMTRLDAAHLEDGHLLLHSDTTAYLDYGQSIEAVNDTVHEVLQRGDADECWDLFRKFTKRFAFRGESGPGAVRKLLSAYGGRRVVHGHSPIPYLLGEVGSENGESDSPPSVTGPHVYADDLAVAMDGGVTMEGRLLVAQLPLVD